MAPEEVFNICLHFLLHSPLCLGLAYGNSIFMFQHFEFCILDLYITHFLKILPHCSFYFASFPQTSQPHITFCVLPWSHPHFDSLMHCCHSERMANAVWCLTRLSWWFNDFRGGSAVLFWMHGAMTL